MRGALNQWDLSAEAIVIAAARSATTMVITPIEQGPYLQALTMKPATGSEWPAVYECSHDRDVDRDGTLTSMNNG
jgi:hypothetical protein